MLGAPVSEGCLTLYGSFTSSSSYKPMLYLALAGLPFSFRTVNLKIGVWRALFRPWAGRKTVSARLSAR